MFYSEEWSVRCIFSAGSKRLTEAVEHTGRTYDEIGEMIAEQVGIDEFLKCFPSWKNLSAAGFQLIFFSF